MTHRLLLQTTINALAPSVLPIVERDAARLVRETRDEALRNARDTVIDAMRIDQSRDGWRAVLAHLEELIVANHAPSIVLGEPLSPVLTVEPVLRPWLGEHPCDEMTDVTSGARDASRVLSADAASSAVMCPAIVALAADLHRTVTALRMTQPKMLALKLDIDDCDRVLRVCEAVQRASPR